MRFGPFERLFRADHVSEPIVLFLEVSVFHTPLFAGLHSCFSAIMTTLRYVPDAMHSQLPFNKIDKQTRVLRNRRESYHLRL
jgi:hypothetical protein